MRILFLGNNWVGWKILEWLNQEGEQVIGLILNPPEKQNYGNELIETSGLNEQNVFDGSNINDPMIIQQIQRLNPDIAISVYFGCVLSKDIINIFPAGVLNLHPALLPYNRGANPNIWSIVDGTPAGVTIHYIDEGIDTGDIVAQTRVDIEPVDTGKTLYRKLEQASVKIFIEHWSYFRSGKFDRINQEKNCGSIHNSRDVDFIDHIDIHKSYLAKDLINILRARTFPPFPGAYFLHEGKKIYLRLELLYEDELNG